MKAIKELADRVHDLTVEAKTLYYVLTDPRVPLHARVVVILVLAYVLSPIDLIPDVIPVVGWIDDIIIIPLGLALARWLVGDALYRELRAKAEGRPAGGDGGDAGAKAASDR